jgi:RHS repeat-associated protein
VRILFGSNGVANASESVTVNFHNMAMNDGSSTPFATDGSEGMINYKYRVHDPRLDRFLSIDPLAPQCPHNSQYAFSENRVIDGVELEGL